jgi:hypothetical protein
MSPLIISQEVIAVLQRLRDLAPLHPVDMPTLLGVIETPDGKRQHMAQMSAQTIEIPGPWPFLVTFSIETGHPIGTCRHMSMSIARAGRIPNPIAVWMIAEHLGFIGGLEACQAWPEELQGHGMAINIVQSIENQPC